VKRIKTQKGRKNKSLQGSEKKGATFCPANWRGNHFFAALRQWVEKQSRSRSAGRKRGRKKLKQFTARREKGRKKRTKNNSKFTTKNKTVHGKAVKKLKKEEKGRKNKPSKVGRSKKKISAKSAPLCGSSKK
jgi:hypothetical protein